MWWWGFLHSNGSNSDTHSDADTRTGTRAGPGGCVAHGERQQSGRRRDVHAVGDGAQRRRRRCSGDDAARLPVDRRNDYDLGRLGRLCPNRGACRRGDDQRVVHPDGAVDGRDVLLRRVRRRSARRVRHDEQLLGIGAGHGVGAGGADSPGPGGRFAFGERQQPGRRRDVHAVGDGAQRRGRRCSGDDAARLPVDRRNDYDLGRLGRRGRKSGSLPQGRRSASRSS